MGWWYWLSCLLLNFFSFKHLFIILSQSSPLNAFILWILHFGLPNGLWDTINRECIVLYWVLDNHSWSANKVYSHVCSGVFGKKKYCCLFSLFCLQGYPNCYFVLAAHRFMSRTSIPAFLSVSISLYLLFVLAPKFFESFLLPKSSNWISLFLCPTFALVFVQLFVLPGFFFLWSWLAK